jgi:signal transduction histidine kinase
VTSLRRRVPGGLRWRFVIALVLTSAVSLGVAAVVVLQPLQDDLRAQSSTNLEKAVFARQADFQGAMDVYHRHLVPMTFPITPRALTSFYANRTASNVSGIAFDLSTQTDAQIRVMDKSTLAPDDRTDEATVGFIYDTQTAQADPRSIDAALRVLRTREPIVRVDGDDLIVGIPLYDADGLISGTVLAQKRLVEVSTVVAQVRNAFLLAGGIGLLVALVLAFGLSSTLLRRLRRLRRTAVRLSRDGADAPTPYEDHRDEVGDLARALARMREELRRQEAARRAFVSTASHELRTPLTMLQGTMELLEEDLRGGRLDIADAQDQVAGARRELRRLSVLAGELLDLSRLDADVPLRADAIELGELARAVAAEFELAAVEAQVALEAVPPDGPCWVRADPDAVARVVRILVDNALRYAPPGDTVQLLGERRAGDIVVSVVDHGPGVPPEERERIFERFFRGSRTGSVSGFGLGLAIGRELARRMGGELVLAETGGARTRFALRLPAAPAQPPVEQPEPAAEVR